jgi:hypothetical protein
LIKTSPPTGSPNIRKLLAPLSHLINCDGGKDLPNFFGESGAKTVVSMTSDDVAKGAKRNTIVAAECCYGAQLFKPPPTGELPIATAYLNAGAVAFLGSTNIAYGSLDGNSTADLMAQYFFSNVLDAQSVGRSLLQARQQFVRTQKMANPVNLKTLAQFILLGDPSLQPVRGEGELQFHRYINRRESRRRRRIALAAAGEAATSCSAFPGRRLALKATKMHRLVRRIAIGKGFEIGGDAVKGYKVVGRYNYANEMKERNVEQNVFVVMHQEKIRKKAARGVTPIRIMVAHAENDSLTDIIEYFSR